MNQLADPRHRAGWYDQRSWAYGFEIGDRMLIRCASGAPCQCRVEHFPPRLEIEAPEGLYVLADDGEPHEWFYDFLPGSAEGRPQTGRPIEVWW